VRRKRRVPGPAPGKPIRWLRSERVAVGSFRMAHTEAQDAVCPKNKEMLETQCLETRPIGVDRIALRWDVPERSEPGRRWEPPAHEQWERKQEQRPKVFGRNFTTMRHIESVLYPQDSTR